MPRHPSIYHLTTSLRPASAFADLLVHVHKDVKSRVIVIGDIHGCYDELRDLLDACKYTPEQDTVCACRYVNVCATDSVGWYAVTHICLPLRQATS